MATSRSRRSRAEGDARSTRFRRPSKRVIAALVVVLLLVVVFAFVGRGKTSATKQAAKTLQEGVAALRAGNLDLAVKDFTDVTKKDKHNKFAYYNLGLIAQDKGDKATAETNYRLALSIDPKFAAALYNLGIVRTALGDRTGAVALYRQAIAAAPNDPAPHFNLGIALRDLGRAADGNAEIAKAVALDPSLAARAPKGSIGPLGG